MKIEEKTGTQTRKLWSDGSVYSDGGHLIPQANCKLFVFLRHSTVQKSKLASLVEKDAVNSFCIWSRRRRLYQH